MIVKTFTFNPFQENTYLIYDDSKETIIIDPGCYEEFEINQLFKFIDDNQLKPKAIFNTHCHIDHVFGINPVRDKYGIDFFCHKDEIEVLDAVPAYAPVYGLRADEVKDVKLVSEEEILDFGNTKLEIRLCPGHSPASLCFIHHESKQVIAGDVLFQGSIGRFDLPGGNYETLMSG